MMSRHPNCDRVAPRAEEQSSNGEQLWGQCKSCLFCETGRRDNEPYVPNNRSTSRETILLKDGPIPVEIIIVLCASYYPLHFPFRASQLYKGFHTGRNLTNILRTVCSGSTLCAVLELPGEDQAKPRGLLILLASFNFVAGTMTEGSV